VSRTRRGFTLIELLVVIAIIAILAAILFPVFARAKAKANQTNCLSNFKNVILAIHMYCQDYDETMPRDTFNVASFTTPNGEVVTTGQMPWMIAVYPYAKNVGVFNCPSWNIKWEGGNSNWESNMECVTDGWNDLCNLKTLACFYQPAQCMVIGEKFTRPYYYGGWTLWAETSTGHDFMAIDHTAEWGGTNDQYNKSRHANGCNMAFADGHAKWMESGAVPRDTWDLGYADNLKTVFWNPDYGTP